MYRNIYKSSWVVVQDEEKCVIDHNKRIMQALENMGQEMKSVQKADMEEEPGAFSEGLDYQEISALLDDQDIDESGNILKAATVDLEEIQAQADEIIAQANAQAADIIERAMKEAAQNSETLKNQAFQQGYDEGMNRAYVEEEAMRGRLAQEKADLEAFYEGQLNELEASLVHTISKVYEHVFKVDLSPYKEIVLQLVGNCMRHVEGNRSFLVHVSSKDYEFVNSKKEWLLETYLSGNGTVEVIEDFTMQEGQCLLETEYGIMDCGLDVQLEELSKKLRLLSYGK